MKLIRACMCVFVLAMTPCMAWAGLEDQVREIIQAGGMSDADFAVHALDLTTKESLVSISADRGMIPASNMKLFTTAAALHVLGADFSFKTSLDRIDTAAGQTVLVVRGDGDPGFGDPILIERFNKEIRTVDDLVDVWVKAVTDAGIKRVDRLVMDDRVFDRELVHPSWPVEQLNRWYCAEVSGLNFHSNVINFYAKATRMSESPSYSIDPKLPGLVFVNKAKTGTRNTLWISRKANSNEMGIYGQVPRTGSSAKVTIHDPANCFGGLLAEKLRHAGVTVGRVDRPGATDGGLRGMTMLEVKTPLTTILDRTNKDSHNLYAESLIKRMGRQYTGAAGGWDNGGSAIRAFLTQRALGPTEAAAISIADGSGMSRDNRITARAMVHLLRYMNDGDPDESRRKVFFNSLSVGGGDGTLRNRFRTGLTGKVYGKSGYLNGVSTLSGYIVIRPAAQPEPGGAEELQVEADEIVEGVSDEETDATNPSRPATRELQDLRIGATRVIAFSILFNESKRTLSEMQAVQNRIVDLLDESAAPDGVVVEAAIIEE